jgi:hypothetical protein
VAVNEWLDNARGALAAASGRPASELELDADTVRILLDLARVAAHEGGARTNAPLVCYLLGRAGGDVETLARAVIEQTRSGG